MELFKFQCERNTALATAGVTTDPAKLKTLQKWSTPKNIHDFMNCNSLVAIVTRLWVARSVVEPLQGQDISPIQWAPIVISSEVKRPNPEAKHSSPPSANIKSHTLHALVVCRGQLQLNLLSGVVCSLQEIQNGCDENTEKLGSGRGLLQYDCVCRTEKNTA
jgi:hypothetical protein